MKLFGRGPHTPPVFNGPKNSVEAKPTFDDLYRAWFGPVTRWLRALGGPDTDIEDLAQDVFLVVQRKLGDFDGQHLSAWLYRITQLTLSDHRRRSWFLHLVKGRASMEGVELRSTDDPHDAFDQRERERMLHRLVGKMSQSRRETFLLYEVMGMSGEEISELQNVPVNTVWTRLHAGRKQFLSLVAAEPAWDAQRSDHTSEKQGHAS
jgi:RNA polymerase sigma-70 factor, ECF subfamily